MIKKKHNQKGAALLIALIMLLAITMLGVSSLRSGIFHEKMSLNSQSETLTFMGAESSINGVMSFAWQLGENGVADTFFADAVLGKPQTNCITKTGLTAAACANVNESLDVRATGVLFAQAVTEYAGQTKIYNSDPDTLAYHKFSSIGNAYLRQDLDLPFATKNQQDWKKLGVATAFSMNKEHIQAAKAALPN